jgi:hypothetical protein
MVCLIIFLCCYVVNTILCRWLQAEDPWQTLAACKELHAALQLDDPTQYLSRLPVHQVNFFIVLELCVDSLVIVD